MSSGAVCRPNQQGEILIKSELKLSGYLKQPEATKDLFDQDGFIRTGDLGYYDDQGNLYYLDRIKSLIKYQASLRKLTKAFRTQAKQTNAFVKEVNLDLAGYIGKN